MRPDDRELDYTEERWKASSEEGWQGKKRPVFTRVNSKVA